MPEAVRHPHLGRLGGPVGADALADAVPVRPQPVVVRCGGRRAAEGLPGGAFHFVPLGAPALVPFSGTTLTLTVSAGPAIYDIPVSNTAQATSDLFALADGNLLPQGVTPSGDGVLS